MPFKHKLSRRLAMLWTLALVAPVAVTAGCVDGGPLGNDLGSAGSGNQIVAIRATSDNPTVAPDQPTTVRAVAITSQGASVPVEADWVTLDGGELRDTVVNSRHMTYFSAKVPGDYRLVSFDRKKQFRDTTRVTVPRQNSVSLSRIYIIPAVVSLAVGQGQQFFVYGRTTGGDSVPVVASLQSAAGGTASGLYYAAGDTAGTFKVVAKQQGGPLTDTASVTVAAPAAAAPPAAPPAAPSSPTTTTDTAVVTAPLAPVSSSTVELPRINLDTRYVPPTGNTIVVPAGGDLQAALNAAARGDVIELAAGATFTGNFTLPAKSGTGWITIRSATTLPAEGIRVTPASAAGFAKLRSPNAMPTVTTAASGSASYYRLMGLDIGSSASMTYSLVQLYNGDATSVDQIPQWIVLDRVYVHGTSTQGIQRCVMLNSRSSAVVDSWLSDCHLKGTDAQAIVGWSAPGPYKITNNHLEGSGENVMFGGSDPRIAGVVPSDITITGNHFYKPLSWAGLWTIKNLFEIKNAQRVLLQGNVLENNWADGQVGFAIVMKSVNQSGGCNWCVAQDITVRGNLIQNSTGGFNLAAQQNESGGTSIPMNSVLIAENVFEGVAQSTQVGTRALFQILGAISDMEIAHNSGFTDDKVVIFDNAPTVRLIMRDNLFSRGLYGVFGSAHGEGNSALSYYAPDGTFRGNIVVAAPVSQYPTSNYYPTSSLTLDMTNAGSGDYTLTSGSPYYTSGTDGTAPGANVTAVMQSVQNVR